MTILKDRELKNLQLDSPLWNFAGRIWSSQAAKDACLELQAKGWSVTDILCALWLSSGRQCFSGLNDASALAWRTQITEPLRQMRTLIKKDNPGTDAVRNSIAGSELEAERVELALAYRTLADTVTQDESRERTAKTLALDNLQAAAPEMIMDNNIGVLLEILARELPMASCDGEPAPC